MNEEKKIARAIIDAQAMRERSYVIPSVGDTYGEYQLDIETCLQRTCKKHGLSENLWHLLSLAMHWWNDIQLWADDILAGKNILEECQKENAKMKDKIKRVEKAADESEDKGCPCNVASTENCAQCRETDSNGNLLDSHRR